VRCFKNTIPLPDPTIVSLTYDPAAPAVTTSGVTVTITFDSTGSIVEDGRIAITPFSKGGSGKAAGGFEGENEDEADGNETSPTPPYEGGWQKTFTTNTTETITFLSEL
jgi:hypothetical protein